MKRPPDSSSRVAAVEASVYAAGLPTDAGAVLIVELDGPVVEVDHLIEKVSASDNFAKSRKSMMTRRNA